MEKIKGKLLLQLARKTIAGHLGLEPDASDQLETALADEEFTACRGTFVTLTINHQLRGCIGNLSADKTILEGVRDNAVNAAFHDPRFPALSKKELDHVAIEISLLTEPQALEYSNAEDLLTRLRPGIDGLIIRKGGRSATFLPQVWEQLPDKQMFLRHLCSKAGLPADAWQRPGLEVQTYQVQYFHEQR
ncbi:MAG: AmmeMemoRadiSam system protein A [Desulfobacteraceae bacterium]|nr:MAG: AmmeMemoRadiSam system protein A [Desulfobacteraceae bacterium]